jgi:glucosamine--fructose-6-phosphate aminotransferase (isomerizing)
LREEGAAVLSAFEDASGPNALPVVIGLHPAVAPLASAKSFYPAASALAPARGFDPDHPEHLCEMTKTN